MLNFRSDEERPSKIKMLHLRVGLGWFSDGPGWVFRHATIDRRHKVRNKMTQIK